MKKTKSVVLVVSVALVASVACTQDFGTFEGTPPVTGPDGASPLPPPDAGPSSDAALTDTSNPGDGGCTSAPDACLVTRATCRSGCDVAYETCDNGCPTGGAGFQCRFACFNTRNDCRGNCNDACETCGGSCTRGCN